jgi:hypothetical protein
MCCPRVCLEDGEWLDHGSTSALPPVPTAIANTDISKGVRVFEISEDDCFECIGSFVSATFS